MNGASAWIRQELRDAPPSLVSVILEALDQPASDSAADDLATAAVRLYSRVVASSGGREDALTLLAADALLTHAFHASALESPETIAEFARRMGADGDLSTIPLT